jgi:hypothetical protein
MSCEFEYLGESDFILETDLEHDSADQVGSLDEKKQR